MRIAVLALISAATQVAAEPVLHFPMDCKLGEDCFVQNYVDRDPGPGVRDFACDDLSYDGHQGVDIALHSMRDLQRHVAIFAAADGVVLGRRNTMQDKILTQPGGVDVEGRECGNGVVLDHGDGWHTQYCHLMQGSVTVQRGDRVTAGQTLGFVGASGNTTFPHLHFSTRHNDVVIDPFDADETATCDTAGRSLWAEPFAHVDGGLIATSIDEKVPEYADLKSDQTRPRVWPRNAPAMVVWSFGFGINKGDFLDLQLIGPDGEVFAETITSDNNRAQFFYAWGRKTPRGGWQAGAYQARATLRRGERVLDAQHYDFTIE